MEFSERTERLASALGVEVSELPELIGVGSSVFFGGRSGKVPVSPKTWRKLQQAESFHALNKAPAVSRAQERPASRVSEDVVAPYDSHRRETPTRAACEQRLVALLDLADKIPGGLAVVYSDLSLSLAEIRRRLAAHEESEQM